MKPTPTPEMIDIALSETPFIPNDGNRAWMKAALSAALSVQPAAAVVGEPVAFMTHDQMRAITARELSTIPNDKGRRDNCANIYPVPLYAAPSAPDGWQSIETGGQDDANEN